MDMNNCEELRQKSIRENRCIKIKSGDYYINGIRVWRNNIIPSGYWGSWYAVGGKSFSSLTEAKNHFK